MLQVAGWSARTITKSVQNASCPNDTAVVEDDDTSILTGTGVAFICRSRNKGIEGTGAEIRYK